MQRVTDFPRQAFEWSQHRAALQLPDDLFVECFALALIAPTNRMTLVHAGKLQHFALASKYDGV